MGEKTDLEMVKRFEALQFKYKIAFSESNFRDYPSVFTIKGYQDGLGVITLYDNFFGKRIVDQFDYVDWLNQAIE